MSMMMMMMSAVNCQDLTGDFTQTYEINLVFRFGAGSSRGRHGLPVENINLELRINQRRQPFRSPSALDLSSVLMLQRHWEIRNFSYWFTKQ